MRTAKPPKPTSRTATWTADFSRRDGPNIQQKPLTPRRASLAPIEVGGPSNDPPLRSGNIGTAAPNPLQTAPPPANPFPHSPNPRHSVPSNGRSQPFARHADQHQDRRRAGGRIEMSQQATAELRLHFTGQASTGRMVTVHFDGTDSGDNSPSRSR